MEVKPKVVEVMVKSDYSEHKFKLEYDKKFEMPERLRKRQRQR